MRETSRDIERLNHMINAIEVVLSRYKNYKEREIEEDPILFYGFVKHLEMMGDAAYMLTKEFKATNDLINWKVIEGLRHVLVHGYYKIKPAEIFNTINNDLEPILYNLRKILNKYPSE
jgi:uncharacterized protein with HEPN domain